MAPNKQDWAQAGEPLALPEETVDVWRLALDQPPERIEQAQSLLSDAEKARAARFRFERDQNCYTLTRGKLRELLGRYLDRSPTAITFVEGEHGKPALADDLQPKNPVEFNVSHSGGFSLLAFARGRKVGVDVEEIRPRKSLDLVAEHHFSPEEREAVAEGDEDGLLGRFYRCWTRKEAYMKATGKGVALGLKTFAVSVDDRPQVLWTDRGDADRWKMFEVVPGEGYVGAVCVEVSSCLKTCRALTLPRVRFVEGA